MFTPVKPYCVARGVRQVCSLHVKHLQRGFLYIYKKFSAVYKYIVLEKRK